jgi:hypothetical protein|tara:strand:+ start:1043 stop:1729 length:687 start_codon:yes stop_codon:yes gene_type:complete
MKASFKKNHFLVIKEAVDPKIANFIYNYFLMKRQVARTMYDTRYISPFTTEFGVWNDQQVPNTYSHYADLAMETLLLSVQPKMEKLTGLKLNPTYSYARIYKKGDILNRHKDRFSCEISTTMNLGGDEWPIYLENKKNVGNASDIDPKTGKNYLVSTDNKGKEIILKPGDMLVYKGQILEHWREVFLGDNCAQVFLHYNDVKSEGADKNIYDGRPHLGLPAYFKGFKL